MKLYLRKVVHPQAHDNYRVVLKRDGDEFEIGSIGIQDGAAWAWAIDTVIPMRAHAPRQFKGEMNFSICHRDSPQGQRVP